MKRNIFFREEVSLNTLLEMCRNDEIGTLCSDRPFHWDDLKVLNLINSIYLGHPVGCFIFWEADSSFTNDIIGCSGKKSFMSKWVIVDGYQRIRAIDSIFNSGLKLRSSSEPEISPITYNLDEERFVLSKKIGMHSQNWIGHIDNFFSRELVIESETKRILTQSFSYKISEQYKKKIAHALESFENMKEYMFSCIIINRDIDADTVAEIYANMHLLNGSLFTKQFILNIPD